jgi:recombination protein RecT
MEEQKKDLSISQYVTSKAVAGTIDQVLKEKASQFIASVSSLVAGDENLKKCDNGSILRACLVAASLNLPINPNLGFAYIIPYNNNKKKVTKGENGKELVVWETTTVAQFQMGYKGFIQLAMRSGQFKTLHVNDVREGEITENNMLTGEIKFEWLQVNREQAKIIGYVAYMRLTNGFEKSHNMTVEELKSHGLKYSQTFKKGFGKWKDEFDAMARKTVVKLLLSKYAPMTVEMETAQLADQAVVKDDGYDYTDNQKESFDDVNDSKENARVLAHITNAKTIDELKQCKDALSEATEEAYAHKEIELMELEEAKQNEQA